MREILFRAKLIDKETIVGEDFFYGDLIHYSDNTLAIRQKETGSEFEVNPKTVGQFTELTDKNGIDLYDGDIVSESGRLWIIMWNEDDLRWWVQDTDIDSMPMCELDFNEIKKVGNIHDNPELLS